MVSPSPSGHPQLAPGPIPPPNQVPASALNPGPASHPVVDPDLEAPEEHPAKRPRLDPSRDSVPEDDAVLNALAVHSQPTPGENYTQEECAHP